VRVFDNIDINGGPVAYNQDPAHGIARTTVTSGINYTLQDSDRYVGIQVSGAAMGILVPDARGRLGKEWTIVREDATGNSFTVQPASSGYSVLGSTSATTIVKNAISPSVTLVSDGSNWWGKP
jgi:hypothetical protein